VRLRMNGGLTLRGESADCLSAEHAAALIRADARSARRSWLWRRVFHQLRRNPESWAATGVVTLDGYLKPVVLEPKLRACLQRHGIKNILTPRQPGADRQAVGRIAAALRIIAWRNRANPASAGGVRLAFAAEGRTPANSPVRPCRAGADVFGGLTSTTQTAESPGRRRQRHPVAGAA